MTKMLNIMWFCRSSAGVKESWNSLTVPPDPSFHAYWQPAMHVTWRLCDSFVDVPLGTVAVLLWNRLRSNMEKHIWHISSGTYRTAATLRRQQIADWSSSHSSRNNHPPLLFPDIAGLWRYTKLMSSSALNTSNHTQHLSLKFWRWTRQKR